MQPTRNTPRNAPGPSADEAATEQAPVRATPGAALRAALGNTYFRTLFVAHSASNFGDWLAFMALFSLSAFEWKADVMAISILGLAYMLPFVLVSPWAGVWVDRWDLRRVLIAGDALRAALVAAMAFSSQFVVLALLLFLHQVVACFFNPAQHAAIPRLLPRDQLLAANALNSQAAQVTKILGPGVAGALVAWLGVRGCFVLDAATFALSALLLARLPSMPALSPAARAPGSFRSELRAGARSLWDAARLRTVVVMLSLSMFALGAFIVALPVFARDQFGAGPRLMGLLLSALGVGAALGAFAVVSLGRYVDKLVVVAMGMLLSALCLALFPVIPGALAGALATSILGAAQAALVVPAHALFQEEAPRDSRARVMSFALAALAISQALGMGFAGGAANVLSTATVLRGTGSVFVVVGLVVVIWSIATQRGAAVNDTAGSSATATPERSASA